MKGLLKISTLLFILLVLCAPSCVDEREVELREIEMLEETREEIRQEFETDYLDEESLFAYEVTAMQKLTDFADYFQLLTDTALDLSFRKKAGALISISFRTDKVTLFLSENEEEMEVDELIRKGLKNKLAISSFNIGSVRVNEPLKRDGAGFYAGSLLFTQSIVDSPEADKEATSIDRSAAIFVVKEDKIFGDDTLKIWKVQLGAIR